MLIHSIVIDETGGSHGVRDSHVILALEQLPRQKFGGQELYKTIFEKAAVYARNIIMGHPLNVTGLIRTNKRIKMVGIIIES